MSKRRLTLRVRLPAYQGPRNHWRRQIHAAVEAAQRRRGVQYRPGDRLEVRVRLYLDGAALGTHDVDNRLKDVLDALQGRAGGPKAVRTLVAIIPNDKQIYRVIVEKAAPPKQSRGLGHLSIARLSDR